MFTPPFSLQDRIQAQFSLPPVSRLLYWGNGTLILGDGLTLTGGNHNQGGGGVYVANGANRTGRSSSLCLFTQTARRIQAKIRAVESKVRVGL
jgi:hypothetical protein